MDQALIIGHSHLKYYDNYIKDPKTKVISHSGCMVEDLFHFEDVRKEIASSVIIVIHCGINNLPRDQGDVLFQKFMTLFHNIRCVNSHAQVVMSQMLPRSQNELPNGKKLPLSLLQQINSTVDYVNDKLAEAAHIVEGLSFMFHPDFFYVEAIHLLNRKMLSGDGLHLSNIGTRYIVANTERSIQFAKFLFHCTNVQQKHSSQTTAKNCNIDRLETISVPLAQNTDTPEIVLAPLIQYTQTLETVSDPLIQNTQTLETVSAQLAKHSETQVTVSSQSSQNTETLETVSPPLTENIQAMKTLSVQQAKNTATLTTVSTPHAQNTKALETVSVPQAQKTKALETVLPTQAKNTETLKTVSATYAQNTQTLETVSAPQAKNTETLTIVSTSDARNTQTLETVSASLSQNTQSLDTVSAQQAKNTETLEVVSVSLAQNTQPLQALAQKTQTLETVSAPATHKIASETSGSTQLRTLTVKTVSEAPCTHIEEWESVSPSIPQQTQARELCVYGGGDPKETMPTASQTVSEPIQNDQLAESQNILSQNSAGSGEAENVSDKILQTNVFSNVISDPYEFKFDAIQYCKIEEKQTFNFFLALKILINPDLSKISSIPPHHPEGDTVYVFSDGQAGKNVYDWKADGYTWRYIGKKEKIISGITVQKVYFHIKNGTEKNSKFKRSAYRIVGEHDPKLTLVAYEGDDNEYKALPHGNAKSQNSRPFKRTMPSVLETLKTKISENPVNQYNAKDLHNKLRSNVSVNPQYVGILNPRNSKQIANLQASVKKSKLLTHDSLYNLHELYYHLNGYITEIKTAPDLTVIAAHPDIIEEFERLLQLKGDESVCLFYDTTFETGDFYISTLAFQHFMFEGEPIIPLSFMIHERRKEICHVDHFNFLRTRIPRLKTKQLPIITDREKGIRNAFETIFPNFNVFVCWNHIFRDLDFWLKKRSAPSDNIKVYKTDIRKLMQCSSETEYCTLLETLKINWTESFLEYFEQNLDHDISQNAGRWLLEKFGLYNPYSGITNNASESLNAKLKRLLDWKEKCVDTAILYLYYWQGNDLHDIMSGFCNVGDFSLRKKFKNLQKNPEDVDITQKSCHPDDILELVKCHLTLTPIQENNLIECQEIYVEKEPEPNFNVNSNNIQPQKLENKSQSSLAMKTIHDKSITLVPEMQGFMIKGTTGKKYAVTLFPKETCQCPSTGRCYHIIAARLSIGLEAEDNKKRICNLTQLRKNSRSRKNKKSGRKRPREGDLDDDLQVNPAPDSILCKSLNETGNLELSESDGEMLISHSTPKTDKKSPKTPRSILKNKHATSDSKKRLRFNAKLNKLSKTLTSDCSPVKPSKSPRKVQTESPSETTQKPKKPKLDCTSEEINIDLNASRSSEDFETFEKEYWIKDLFLKDREKNELTKNKKLSSYHMEAVNIIARDQFPNINGFQISEKVPKYISSEKRWNVGSVMNPVSLPACQIHHTSNDHWVVSFLDKNNTIFLFDSLGNERPENNILTESLKLQLAVIYGSTNSSIDIVIPETHRQNNAVDCGLYAIAHLTEFCINDKPVPNVIFDTTKLRIHLLACLEKRELSAFPKTNKLLNSRQKRDPKIFNLQLYCICTLPECLDSMIKCNKCNNSFHKNCVMPPNDKTVPEGDFLCFSCC